ncbi:hypothetical protein NP233_g3753 [Leucocoprinus birnbaumii]|uniref:Uncharacterized protein n=1 Tax=Leucocoprinus birnbaumii TaxID=56174 RepID=A0AAD5VVX3_9AGAR|nr:hypothetical protein NP233_g3753 [Leucocoprinus birnbaumii]
MPSVHIRSSSSHFSDNLFLPSIRNTSRTIGSRKHRAAGNECLAERKEEHREGGGTGGHWMRAIELGEDKSTLDVLLSGCVIEIGSWIIIETLSVWACPVYIRYLVHWSRRESTSQAMPEIIMGKCGIWLRRYENER